MDGIGIGEEQPFANCSLRAAMRGVTLPRPARRKRRRIDDFHSTIAASNLAGTVRGIVVDDNDFVVDSGLLLQRPQALAKAGFLVARGNDHRHDWFTLACRFFRGVGVHDE